MKTTTLTVLFSVLCSAPAWAAPKKPPKAEKKITKKSEAEMKLDMLDTIIRRIDPKANRSGNQWQFEAEGYPVFVITDPRADRMRAMTPVTELAKVKPAEQLRMLQANFDSVLDVRYSVARGTVWSAFIHPLGDLTELEFVSAIAQVVTAAATFGSTYSSGALVFGGGDSAEINEKLYQKLMKKGLIEL